MLHLARVLVVALVMMSMPAFSVTDNIILFVLDDMRVDDRINTPNIDALAAAGTRFTSAYATGTYCLTSRTSMMFGLRAQELTRVPILGYRNSQAYKDIYENPDVVSLPQILSDAGYLTAATGKVFHDSVQEAWRWDVNGPKTDISALIGEYGYFVVVGDTPHDQAVADWAEGFIRDIPQQPFFLAVGLLHPHVPVVVPALDYPEITGYIAHPDELDHVPPNYDTASRVEFYQFLVDQGLLDTETRGYMTAATYSDGLIGQVMQALYDTGQTAHVIVVSDHGYHLGEKSHWGKTTFWEQTIKVPLVIMSPDYPPGVIDKPVSLLDLAPTILAMADVDPHPQFEGVPLLNTTTKVETHHYGGVAQITGKMKRIDINVDVDDPNDILLYNLKTDPQETVNLYGQTPGC